MDGTARTALLVAAPQPNAQAFLRVLRSGETNQTDAAYREQVGGTFFSAPPWQHPHKLVQVQWKTPDGVVHQAQSSAAGAYQFLSPTWDGLVELYGFEDFSPRNQDLGALGLIYGRQALGDVLTGQFASAIAKCSKEWASLPGKDLSVLRRVYAQWGGVEAV